MLVIFAFQSASSMQIRIQETFQIGSGSVAASLMQNTGATVCTNLASSCAKLIVYYVHNTRTGHLKYLLAVALTCYHSWAQLPLIR